MVEYDSAKEFWEDKILPWEEARYSALGGLSPLSWTVRRRLYKAVKMVHERMHRDCGILELACGSGHLAGYLRGHCARYTGIDIASKAIEEARTRLADPAFVFTDGDVFEVPWSPADLTIFLGLTDWLNPPDLHRLFQKIASPEILFSYTEAGSLNPYRLYRRWMDSPQEERFDHAKMYPTAFMLDLISSYGFKADAVVAPTVANPGGLIWAVRTNSGSPAGR